MTTTVEHLNTGLRLNICRRLDCSGYITQEEERKGSSLCPSRSSRAEHTGVVTCQKNREWAARLSDRKRDRRMSKGTDQRAMASLPWLCPHHSLQTPSSAQRRLESDDDELPHSGVRAYSRMLERAYKILDEQLQQRVWNKLHHMTILQYCTSDHRTYSVL
ncbi:hypothetical protein PAMP_021243 [Pampus punctatissimus]